MAGTDGRRAIGRALAISALVLCALATGWASQAAAQTAAPAPAPPPAAVTPAVPTAPVPEPGPEFAAPTTLDRREDIPRLCEHLLARIGEENGVPPKRLSPAALKGLLSYRWPGNVRQLRNALETATLVSQGETIEPGDLPPEVAQAVIPPSSPEPIPLPASRTLTEIERDAIRDALAKTGGNKTQAAKLLGIGLRTLHRKVKEYGIE